jgi:hypothetical protein
VAIPRARSHDVAVHRTLRPSRSPAPPRKLSRQPRRCIGHERSIHANYLSPDSQPNPRRPSRRLLPIGANTKRNRGYRPKSAAPNGLVSRFRIHLAVFPTALTPLRSSLRFGAPLAKLSSARKPSICLLASELSLRSFPRRKPSEWSPAVGASCEAQRNYTAPPNRMQENVENITEKWKSVSKCG